MLTERAIQVGAISLNVAEGPKNGPPLLLLHGGTDRWQTFDPIIPTLAEKWRIYALDFRGHGGSDWVAPDYRIPDYAADITSFVREHIGEPTTFLGHSMGADTSLYIGANAPDVMRAAVLEEPLYSHNGTRVKQFAVYDSLLAFQKAVAVSRTVEGISSELKRARPNWPDTLVTAKAECLNRLDPAVLDLIIEGRHTDGYDTEDLLPRINAPMLIVQGNPMRGGLLNDDEAERMVSLLKNCAFEQIPEGGHEPHSRRPQQFLEIVTNFLASI